MSARRIGWTLASIGIVAASGCGLRQLDRCESAGPGDEIECPMPGYLDRAFTLHVPTAWDGVSELPVIYAFHGGGGNRAAAAKVTCPGGDADHPDCLTAKGTSAGFAVLLPDGTGSRPTRNVRTWNAGGGEDNFQCVSGPACRSGADDMTFLDDLAEELDNIIPVDDARIYATGLSNGAAISHRFACERPERLAAIAPVGGNNQFAASGGGCATEVPILHFHGTADPCWKFEDSTEACLQDDGKLKVGVNNSMEGWRARNGCDATTTEEAIEDADPGDGTTSTRVTWDNCDSATALIRIDGGGHTWPQGDQYFGTDIIGPVAQDYDADDLILEFFATQSR